MAVDPQMPPEPLCWNNPQRSQWVEEQGKRTARAHQSYMAQQLSSYTVHNMQRKENIAAADADGGGTIDRSEFAALLAAAGGNETNADDAAALFASADVDGDGELTEEEIKAIAELKKKNFKK